MEVQLGLQQSNNTYWCSGLEMCWHTHTYIYWLCLRAGWQGYSFYKTVPVYFFLLHLISSGIISSGISLVPQYLYLNSVMPFVFQKWAPGLFEVGAMFALCVFNLEPSLMILVSGSIADFSWTLETAWLAVWRHHVLLSSRSGQTHRLSNSHIRTAAPPVPLIPKHVTGQPWDLVILPASQT